MQRNVTPLQPIFKLSFPLQDRQRMPESSDIVEPPKKITGTLLKNSEKDHVFYYSI
jgi:hypothetical protein